MTVNQIETKMDLFNFSLFFEPQDCETMTVAPVEIPVNNPISRLFIGE